jgi:iron(III) transport system substrate-binding protein
VAAAALTAVVALVMAACGGSAAGNAGDSGEVDQKAMDSCRHADNADWQAKVAKAESEGKVMLYSTLLPEINARLEAAFEKAYPKIDLKIRRTVGQEISAMLDAEKKTGTDGADVVSHVNYSWMYGHVGKGYFSKPVGPSSAGPEWAGTDHLKEGVFQVSLLTGIGIAWRTDLVGNPPKSYADLLKPEYGGGQIGITDAQGNPSTSTFYAWTQQQFGSDFVAKLAVQKPKVYATAVPAQEALLAGEIAVDAWASSVGIADAKEKGAPVEFLLPKPGFAPLNLTYMLSWSKRPNASQVLFDFMACPAGQAALAAKNISVLPNIPGTLGPPDAVTPANLEKMLDPKWVADYSSSWVTTMGR